MAFGSLCLVSFAATIPIEIGAAAGWQEDTGSATTVIEASSPYSAWELGPPTDSDWFPIGVWLQDPRLAERYRKLGINTFVGLWKGPTEDQLAKLTAAGMRVVCGMNKVGRKHIDDPTIIAWMLVDEPDNRGDSGTGPRVAPPEVQASYERLVEQDPKRPVWLNLGQGVANDKFKWRGAKLRDYPNYVLATDIVSFDVYPITNIQREDGENYLWYVAKGVRRLRAWARDRKVVWNMIECTRVGGEKKKPTPAQMRAEVWMSLIYGSRGIVYFCHEFKPKVNADALLDDGAMSTAVASMNAEIKRFAPVLNSPTIPGAVNVRTSNSDVPVSTMLKSHGGAKYLFAIGMRNGATDAEIRIDGKATTTVTVLGEDRELEMVDGRFNDSFEPYAVHVYRFFEK